MEKNLYKNIILKDNINFDNKKVLIMGLGLNGGGVGTCKFLARNGAKLIVTDLKKKEELLESIKKIEYIENIEFVLGEHREDDFLSCDYIIKAAGIKWDNKFIKLAIENGKKVDTDVGIFFELSKNKKVGITGSKGKSTTTTLIYNIYKDYYPDTKIGGNITISVLEDFYPEETDSFYILELSSWQLDDISKHEKSPEIAIFLNLLPDHLNYYKTMEDYFNDKKNIYLYQKSDDFYITNIDNIYIKNDIINSKISSNIIGVTSNLENINFILKNNKNNNKINGFIYFNENNPFIFEIKTNIKTYFWEKIKEINDLNYIKKNNNIEILIKVSENQNLKGIHNQYNIASAIISSLINKIPLKNILKVISNFNGLKYRNEKIRKFNGINFINDTTATVPSAVAATLTSYPSNSIILIAGGMDKKSPLDDMVNAIISKCKAVILLEGDGSQNLLNKLTNNNYKNIYYYYNNLKDAIFKALEFAKEGDNVILSPGFASFNLFKNEFDRGDIFNSIVNSL